MKHKVLRLNRNLVLSLWKQKQFELIFKRINDTRPDFLKVVCPILAAEFTVRPSCSSSLVCIKKGNWHFRFYCSVKEFDQRKLYLQQRQETRSLHFLQCFDWSLLKAFSKCKRNPFCFTNSLTVYSCLWSYWVFLIKCLHL